MPAVVYGDNGARTETLYLTLFSAVFGVTYAFRLSLVSSYGWHFAFAFNSWNWNYSASGILMYVLPVLVAGLFLYSFKAVHDLFNGRLFGFPFLVYVLMVSFSPFFVYHGVQYFLMDRYGLNSAAQGCKLTNVCAGSPAGAMADFAEILGFLTGLGFLFLLATIRQMKRGARGGRIISVMVVLLVLVASSFPVAYAAYANRLFVPRYGVHLAGIQLSTYGPNGTYDSSILQPPQGRAGGILMNGGEFLEELQVIDNRSSPVRILSLILEPGESNGFKILHSSIDDAQSSGGLEIYPGVLTYIYIYMRAPNSDSNYTGFRLVMYES